MFKVASAIFSLVFVGGANAQSFQSIENCRQLVEGADRAACYDALRPEQTPAPKVESEVAQPAHTEQACEMFTLGMLSGSNNCQDGDIVTASGSGARDLPEVVARYCDFDAQILTLPDPTSSGLGGEPNYVVLCKYHKRPSAPKN